MPPPTFRWPAWLSPHHVMVRMERRYWARTKAWQWVQRSLLGCSGVLLLLPLSCGLVFNLTSVYRSPQEFWLGTVLTMMGGALLLIVVVDLVLTLLTNVIAANLIAREREAQTWVFLRLTTLTEWEIVGGKAVALLYILRTPLVLAWALRLLFILLIGLLLGGLVWAFPVQADSLWRSLDNAITYNLFPWLEAFQVLVTLLFVLVVFFLSPLFQLLYNAAIGLCASTLSRGRGSALLLTFALHFGLGLVLYAPIQQAVVMGTSYLLLAPVPNGATPAPSVFINLYTVLPLLIGGLLFFLQTVVGLAALGVTLRRVKHLAD